MPKQSSRHGEAPASLDGGGRFRLRREDFVPAYLKTFEDGGLRDKSAEALALLQPCRVCPRDCNVNRLEDKAGVCRSGRFARVASAFPHFGEEDCLRGWHGSGTIFFAGCNLRCVFCQNYEISQMHGGRPVSAGQLATIMLRLQEAGCHNINFVTPEHVVPQILEALPLAVQRGLRLPLVYNTSAYDSLDSIRLMDGVVDIYMPDFKLWDPDLCARYLLARDYPETARNIVEAMHRQVGELKVDEQGLALRGLLVRHLVMPGLGDETVRVMRFLAGQLSPDTYVNLMDQYSPAWKARTAGRFTTINRSVTDREFDQAVESARDAGLWRLDTRWLNRLSCLE